jgi:hypothetical protein
MVYHIVIEIVELSRDWESAYSEFILADERAMIYATLEFRGFLQRILTGNPRYFVALKSSRVIGALPCFSVTHADWGEVINSLPWYGSHGGCLVPANADPMVRQALLAHYRKVVGQSGIAFTTLILSPQENKYVDEYTATLRPDAFDGRIGQTTELPVNGPDIGTRLERVCSLKTRNLVRKACKQGFSLVIADDDSAWSFLCETHVENMAGIGGQAKPWEHFVAIRQAFPPTWRRLMIAELDGVPVAAMLLLLFNRTVEYITPVIKHEYRSLQPLSFLIWHGMLDAVRSGYRWWNWGGTWQSQKSLHHFKAGWGAQDRPYAYLVHAKPDAVDALRRDRQAVTGAFPFYFLYPFNLLGESLGK